MKSVEISPRQYSIRVYDNHDVNYTASAQICAYGDRCYVYSICGKDFYANMPEILAKMRSLGFSLIEGYAAVSHARLLRILWKKHAITDWILEEDGEGIMAGRRMIWIRMRYAPN